MKLAPKSVSGRVENTSMDLHRRVLEREGKAQAFGAADPVLLHDPDFFRPALETIERREQIVGEVRDLEEPLRQLAALDQRARAPAPALDHLLVGEHGLVDRVPVHVGFGAIDEAHAVEIEEETLLPRVILEIAGGELAAPVDGQAHVLELLAHRRDVGVGPFARMHALLARGVLGGQPEGVPAHRMQHVETLRALEAGDHVAHRVVAHVPHVDAARGIRETSRARSIWGARTGSAPRKTSRAAHSACQRFSESLAL